MSIDPKEAKVFGSALESLNDAEQPFSPQVDFQANGVVMITRTWKVNRDNDLGLMPNIKDLDDLTEYSAKCISVNLTGIAGVWTEIVAVYQGYTTLPPTIFEFVNARLDRPIQMHPRFLDEAVFPKDTKVFDKINPDKEAGEGNQIFSKFKDVISTVAPITTEAMCRFRGIESFIVGSAQWRKTTYSLVPDFDNSDVGALNPPNTGEGDFTPPDPPINGLPDQFNAENTWIKVEKTCVNMMQGASILWIITEVWLHNDLGWTEEIYNPNFGM